MRRSLSAAKLVLFTVLVACADRPARVAGAGLPPLRWPDADSAALADGYTLLPARGSKAPVDPVAARVQAIADFRLRAGAARVLGDALPAFVARSDSFHANALRKRDAQIDARHAAWMDSVRRARPAVPGARRTSWFDGAPMRQLLGFLAPEPLWAQDGPSWMERSGTSTEGPQDMGDGGTWRGSLRVELIVGDDGRIGAESWAREVIDDLYDGPGTWVQDAHELFEIDYCPDANGVVRGKWVEQLDATRKEVIDGRRIVVTEKTGFTATVTGYVNDEANVVGFQIEMTATSSKHDPSAEDGNGKRQETSWGRVTGLTLDGRSEGKRYNRARRGESPELKAYMDRVLEQEASGVPRRFLKQAEDRWRNGACLAAELVEEPASNDLGAGESARLSVKLQHRFDDTGPLPALDARGFVMDVSPERRDGGGGEFLATMWNEPLEEAYDPMAVFESTSRRGIAEPLHVPFLASLPGFQITVRDWVTSEKQGMLRDVTFRAHLSVDRAKEDGELTGPGRFEGFTQGSSTAGRCSVERRRLAGWLNAQGNAISTGDDETTVTFALTVPQETADQVTGASAQKQFEMLGAIQQVADYITFSGERTTKRKSRPGMYTECSGQQTLNQETTIVRIAPR